MKWVSQIEYSTKQQHQQKDNSNNYNVNISERFHAMTLSIAQYTAHARMKHFMRIKNAQNNNKKKWKPNDKTNPFCIAHLLELENRLLSYEIIDFEGEETVSKLFQKVTPPTNDINK